MYGYSNNQATERRVNRLGTAALPGFTRPVRVPVVVVVVTDPTRALPVSRTEG